MTTLSVSEVQSRLPQLIDGLRPGDEVVITRDEKPVARLVAPPPPKGVPVFGRGRDMLVSYLDDDEHLRDFAEHLP